MEAAIAKADAAFAFMERLGLPFFCFHDRDVAPEGETPAGSNARLDRVGSVKNLGRYAASWIAWWPNRSSSRAALPGVSKTWGSLLALGGLIGVADA